MAPASSGSLSVAPATPQDWALVRSWAAEEGWNPGLSDVPAFFAQDPGGFFLGRVDGEPVSAISVVNYGDAYAFLGFYLVRPGLRGRGHGLATWRAALAHAGDRSVGLDGVPAQQDNYRRSGFTTAYRTARFVGEVPAPDRPVAGVVPAERVDPATVAAYDNACHHADRPRFLSAWLTTPATALWSGSSTAARRVTGSSAPLRTRRASGRCSRTPRPTRRLCSTRSPSRRGALARSGSRSTCRRRIRRRRAWPRSGGSCRRSRRPVCTRGRSGRWRGSGSSASRRSNSADTTADSAPPHRPLTGPPPPREG